ncbi:Mpo1-like protein [Marinobacter sp.]|uniref:Mpo1-like protein n=1 Tax=Marinobacter sp. TaxID=50741 RepID=UPI003A93D9CF
MSYQRTFNNFSEFYPYYLEEHSDVICRRLHFAGSLLVILVALWPLIPANRPATFKNPLYSLMGNWVMFRDILIGRIRF